MRETDAREIGIRAHSSQTYGEKHLPYSLHLDMVAGVLAEFLVDSDEIDQVAYLHDILEDTEWTSEDLKKHGFSEDVIGAVEFCTDAPGKNRKERKAATYERMAEQLGVLPTQKYVKLGALVKVADRIVNLRACHIWPNASMLKMYMQEDEAFSEALWGHDWSGVVPDRMWNAYKMLVDPGG